jgi:hypothetical protein
MTTFYQLKGRTKELKISDSEVWKIDLALVWIESKFRIIEQYINHCRSRWSRGLSRGFAAARLLGLLVGIPPGVWMSFSCGCCVLSGRGIRDGTITCWEECDLETSRMRRPTCTIATEPWKINHWTNTTPQKWILQLLR